jgi:uncharacterized protein
MSATIVDGFEFCRLGEQLSGATPVHGFERLTADTADKTGEIRWSFAGGHHPRGFPQLTMKVDGEVGLVCQRCLSPYRQALNSQTVLVLARSEADADETEAQVDDERIDVIVGSGSMDLLQLVEDEALLLLPLSPRHDTCPGDAPKLASDKPESPFSVLKALKN